MDARTRYRDHSAKSLDFRREDASGEYQRIGSFERNHARAVLYYTSQRRARCFLNGVMQLLHSRFFRQQHRRASDSHGVLIIT